MWALARNVNIENHGYFFVAFHIFKSDRHSGSRTMLVDRDDHSRKKRQQHLR